MKNKARLLFLSITLITIMTNAYSQVSYIGTGIPVTKYKSENLRFWYTSILNTDIQYSIIDSYFMRNSDSKFRFGDALGLKAGVGFGRVKHHSDPEEVNKWMLNLDLGYSYGLFAGYKSNSFGLFYKYQIEKYATHQMRTYCDFTLAGSVNTFILTLRDTYYFQYSSGKGIAKTELMDNDKLTRFQFRYYEPDGDMKQYIGFGLDFWDKNVTDRISTVSFIGGFAF